MTTSEAVFSKSAIASNSMFYVCDILFFMVYSVITELFEQKSQASKKEFE